MRVETGLKAKGIALVFCASPPLVRMAQINDLETLLLGLSLFAVMDLGYMVLAHKSTIPWDVGLVLTSIVSFTVLVNNVGKLLLVNNTYTPLLATVMASTFSMSGSTIPLVSFPILYAVLVAAPVLASETVVIRLNPNTLSSTKSVISLISAVISDSKEKRRWKIMSEVGVVFLTKGFSSILVMRSFKGEVIAVYVGRSAVEVAFKIILGVERNEAVYT